MHCSAEGLKLESILTIEDSRSLHSELTPFTCICTAEYGLTFIFEESISCPLRPPNKFLPVSKMNMRLPKLKISALVVNGKFLNTSGAT